MLQLTHHQSVTKVATFLFALFCLLSVGVKQSDAAPTLHKLAIATKHVNPKDGRFVTVDGVDGVEVAVVLPDGYDPAQRYPLITLLHGNDGTPDGFLNPMFFDARSDSMQKFKAIVVIPSIGQHATAVDWQRGAIGGIANWEQFLIKDMLPTIFSRYKVSRDRQQRSIMGLSYGGYTSTYLGAKYPQIWGNVGSVSGVPSILGGEMKEFMAGGFADQSAFDGIFGPVTEVNAKAHDPLTLVDNFRYTRTHIGRGTGIPDLRLGLNMAGWLTGTGAENMIIPANDRFAKAATNAGVNVQYKIGPGVHAWPYFQDTYNNWLAWNPLAGPVNEQPNYWNYNTGFLQGTAWQYDYSFAQRPTNIVNIKRLNDKLFVDGGGAFSLTDRATGCIWSATAPAEGPTKFTYCPPGAKPVTDFEPLAEVGVATEKALTTLKMSTDRLQVGKSKRVRFKVFTSLNGSRSKAVSGAKVTVAGVTRSTDAQGRTVVRVKAKKTGLLAVTVKVAGFPQIKTKIRVQKGKAAAKSTVVRASNLIQQGASPGH